jgi:P63C domain-containing protein
MYTIALEVVAMSQKDEAAEGAKALSALGASKGGLARAKKLTPEQRSEIARAAVQARWAKAGITPLPRATHIGDVKIGDALLKCAVLEDGTRVLNQADFMRAIGRARSPKAGTGVLSTVDELPFFLQADIFKPFITDDLRESTKPIFFSDPGGGKSVGYNALMLPRVCNTYLKLRDKFLQETGKIPERYSHMVRACDLLMRGLADVGIVALVDEATGYQNERARDALAKILEAFIAKELRAWVKTFPVEFYRELFRLRGIPYKEDVKRPQYIGHLTNDLVYARLAPGVLDELRRNTPRDDKGRLKHHLHRKLTEDVGHPKLLQHLSAVTALMKASDGWKAFKALVDKALPKYKRLPLFDGIETKEAKS